MRHFVLVSSMGITQPDHMLNRMFNNQLIWKGRGEAADVDWDAFFGALAVDAP